MPYYLVVLSTSPLEFNIRKFTPEGPGLANILIPSPLHSQPDLVKFKDGRVALITGEADGRISAIIPVLGSFDPKAEQLYPEDVQNVHLPHIPKQNAMTNRLSYLAQKNLPLGMYYQLQY